MILTTKYCMKVATRFAFLDWQQSSKNIVLGNAFSYILSCFYPNTVSVLVLENYINESSGR
jgi:hypothetical protein